MVFKNNKNLIFKESDKGGACVIMDSEYYKSKILNILQDKETYSKLGRNLDNKILKKIEKLTETYKNQLTEKEIKYLTKLAT